ncbi:hypothetical protein ULMS_26660 [Patiriisocius marinistellae]|uniref:DUF192 domain-containing protein n=1 Tax=Patiriisocius marinistellae TaxID=2494560 RepID=A0A5J4G0D8_9FLAO|nr:DUF192 domain-containing protein [Patiriisocius marinistellae]GEQ87158.1 hypothetical protein ULMS_26660 [Patiriisocius marinistellae]
MKTPPAYKYSSILLLFVVLFSACNENKTKVLTKEIAFSNDGRLTVYKQNTEEALHTFTIETAIGEYETQTGLMYRKSLPQDSGMLFMFDNEQPRSFYMKNTEIELDILYIDANKKVVKIYTKAKPMDPTSLPSGVPVKYVLELGGAVSSSRGIQEGDRVEWSLK